MKRWLLIACLAGLFAPLAVDAQYPPYGGYNNPGGAEQTVRDWYNRFLGREPDPMSATWSESLRQGQQPEAVLAQILASSEYYNRGGGSPQGYVRRLITDLTGRPPGGREISFWVNQMYRADRQDIVMQVLQRYPGNWSTGGGGGGGVPYPDEPSYDYRRPYYQPYRR